MPKVIIPDKICPHCGGNEWFYIIRKSTTKRKSHISYCCINKKREDSKIYRERRKQKGIEPYSSYYYKKNKEKLRNVDNVRKKEGRDNLSDWYIRSYIASKKGISSNNVTQEEIIYKRAQIEEYRKKYKGVAKEDRVKLYAKKWEENSRVYLSDAYIKRLIRQANKIKGIKIYNKDISEDDVIKRRALAIANKRITIDSYIKKCIQSTIMKKGDKVSFNDISKRKMHNYRKGLRMLRYYRELNRLLTIKN